MHEVEYLVIDSWFLLQIYVCPWITPKNMDIVWKQYVTPPLQRAITVMDGRNTQSAFVVYCSIALLNFE